MSNVFQNLQLQRIANAIEEGAVTGSITIDVTGAGDMQPATATAAGAHGLVPAPQAGDENKVLSGAGTWIDAGGGELEELKDVTITSPTSGEILKYDGSKWVNGTGAGDMQGATASTAGVHGLVPAPQAGDENKVLSGAGTWIDAGSDVAELGDLADVDITSPTSGESLKYDGSKWVNGNVTADLPDFIEETSGSIVTVNAAERPAKSLVVAINPVQSGSGDPSPENVRPISGWTGCNVVVSPTTDAEDGTTYTIEFKDGYNPLTVYGGTLDVTNGVLTVDRVMVDLGTLKWTKENEHFYSSFINDCIKPSAGAIPNFVCSQYMPASYITVISHRIDNVIGASTTPRLYVFDSRYTDATTFKTAMQGVQLVYPLAEPVTYQLTPTEVQMLLGTNNIWADTGEITELKYINQTYNDLLEEVSDGGGGVSYSTAEQYTGLKWIDGSKIYQITKVYENVAQTSDSNPLTLDTLSDVDTMVRYDVRATTTGGGVINDNFYLDNSYKFHTIYYPDRKSLQYRANWGDSGYFTITITYQYTKRG